VSARHDRVDFAAAYVLGALEAGEVEAFERHLAGCEICRQEAEALQGVVDVLPMAAPQHAPPPGLRRRVVRVLRAEARRPARRRPALRPLGLGRPAFGLALLLAAALASVAVVEFAPGGGSGARIVNATVVGSRGTAELRVARGQGELVVRHLPPPPRGRIYELWLKRPDSPPAPTPTLFSVTSAGAADVGVPGELHGISAVLVTDEPAGGSLAPTRPPVIVAKLS
jgi:anti-sigma-K factor RskA